MLEWKHQTFVGTQLTQSWRDLWLWESFFNRYPVQTFLELGTGVGGASLFFSLQCHARGIHFHTFDNQQFFDFTSGIPPFLNMQSAFHHIDLFSEDALLLISTLLTDLPHPVMLFFDNGDKPREWSIFAPLLRHGDYCAVHDWGKEFRKKDIGKISVEPIELDVRSYMTRWFKIVP